MRPMKNRFQFALLITLIVTIVSCGDKKKEDETDIEKSKKQTATLYVDTLHLKKRIFNKQIVCNGKLRGVVKTDLNFAKPGIITTINVKNGDNILKGGVLAIIDTDEAQIELAKSRRAMRKAELDLIDELISQGYADTTNVPKAIVENTKNRSGYNSALDLLSAAERTLAQCYLKAPFSGRVANMDSKEFSRSSDRLCTLIDDAYFDVEFNVLEAELDQVSRGQRVQVSPFVDDSKEFLGTVTDINPLIDDNGQIKVRAKVRNSGRYLLEGMNVKVILNKEISGQFVVPKNAVVLRDGFDVMFVYIDGEAVWTYVDIVMSNIDSHLITGHKEKQTSISEDDIIITSNNTNLADATKVSLK